MISKILNDIEELNHFKESLNELAFNTFFYQDFAELRENIYQFFEKQEDIAIHLFLSSPEMIQNYDFNMKKYMLNSIDEIDVNFFKLKFLIHVTWVRELHSSNEILLAVLKKLILYYKNSKTNDGENIVGVLDILIDPFFDDPKDYLVNPLKEVCQIIPNPEGGWEDYYDHILKSISLLAKIKSPKVKGILQDLSNSDIEIIAQKAQRYLLHYKFTPPSN